MFAADVPAAQPAPSLVDQVVQLLVGAIPTAILFIVLVLCYQFLVQRPLTKTLAERRARTDGAIETARANVAAADAKTADYEQRLREAKLALYKAQEQRRQQALEQRAKAVAAARAAAEAQIRSAKQAMEQDVAAAKQRLRGDAEALSNEVIRTVLKPVSAAAAGRQ